jgi:hypothetical protein
MEAIALRDETKASRFHDCVYREQSEFRENGKPFLKKIARQVGADMTQLRREYKAAIVKRRIDTIASHPAGTSMRKIRTRMRKRPS